MAHFGKDLDDFKGSRCVHIRSAEQLEHFTLYHITVTIGQYSWTVKHRYSEFHCLHEKLAASHKLDKSLLPPKKIFGNQTESFIKKRQRELEIYLQTIILYLVQHIPTCLAYFLDFDKYEIHGITQAMAEDLYSRGESLLQSRDKYEVSTLQLYSLTERLKLPEPTCDSGDVRKDLGHILDFITRTKHLKVVCSKKPVGASNILMYKLSFDLTLFKSLQTLEICGCNFRQVNGLETVKQTLTKLEVHESTSSMKEVLLQDAPHWKAEDGSVLVGYWNQVTELDLSCNSFSEIHDSIQLIPNVEKLNLSNNVIDSIQNLHWLSELTELDLSHNNIHHVDSLHTKLGNLKRIRLAFNQLESLHGFAKLFSLETLDVSYNKIQAIEELNYVSQLPCVEDLTLEGNPVTSSLDYRTKTLEMFRDRVSEVVLDGRPADQKELDTVAVLQALRKAKDVKISKRAHPRKNASAVSLSDMYCQSSSGSYSDYLEGKSSFAASPAQGILKSSLPSNVTHWQQNSPRNDRRTSLVSQDSYSTFNSVDEAGEDTHHDIRTPSPQPPAIVAAGSPSASRSTVDQMLPNSNNSNRNTVNNIHDVLNTSSHQVIPEAHPFDLKIAIENPASHHPSSLSCRSPNSCTTGQVSQPYHPTKFQSPFPTVPTLPLPPDFCAHEVLSDSRSSMQSQTFLLSPSPPSPSPSPPLYQSESSLKRKTKLKYSAADLPSTSDPGFDLWLNEQLVLSENISHNSSNSEKVKESVTDILWCYAAQLLNPSAVFSCCAVLTNANMFIEKLTGLESSTAGIPELKPFAIVSIQNIQQIVVGPCHAYVRLEEAFLGKSGVFTLFAIEPQGIRRFVNKLCGICSNLQQQGLVDLSIQSDLLKTIALKEELNCRECSDRLVSASLVQVDSQKEFSFLVLSETTVYSLDLLCIQWPPATFETVPETNLKFNFQHEFSISDKISNIKIYPAQDKVIRGKIKHKSTNSNPDIRFSHHGLSLEIAHHEQNGINLKYDLPNRAQQSSCTKIIYHFPSSAYRDLFLDRLSNMRAELAHRVIPSVREEPEGGNEQLTPGDQHMSKPWSLSSSSKSFQSLSTAQSLKLIIEDQSLTPEAPLRVHQDLPVLRSNIPYTEHKLNGKNTTTSSESVTSDRSLGAISLSESEIFSENRTVYQTPTSSTAYFSTSPRDDLSVSPMSNFSRASISPVYGDEPKERKHQSRCMRPTRFSQPAEATRADSLPSSFDWKKFYFKSSPSSSQDVASVQGQYASRSRPQGQSVGETGSCDGNRFMSDRFSIQLSKRFLEDIEQSTELEPCTREETEHELYLKQSVKSFDLIHPLSAKLKPLCLMNGRELRSFFHSVIAQKLTPDHQDVLCEELHYVLWSSVVPYVNPKLEITTLIMLSTYGVYFVSDTSPHMNNKSRPPWMTHSRNRSDSGVGRKSATSAGSRKVVEPYFVLRYKDLQQINVGLFDQCVRLTGRNENSVFTIATRDSVITETFIQKLKHILSLMAPSPSRETTLVELEQDFYEGSFQRTKSTLDGIVYTHPSQVAFVYPGEDAVRDIMYLINEHVNQGREVSLPLEKSSKLWFYIQSYLLPSDEGRASDRTQPRSIVITGNYFCVVEEDIVTYPLPDFVRGLPENPCHEILDCRRIDSLKRVSLFLGNPHCVCLTFFDEPEDIVVDVSMQHFSSAQALGKGRQHTSPEIMYRLYIQSLSERDRMVQILEKLWKELVTQVGRILDINKL